MTRTISCQIALIPRSCTVERKLRCAAFSMSKSSSPVSVNKLRCFVTLTVLFVRISKWVRSTELFPALTVGLRRVRSGPIVFSAKNQHIGQCLLAVFSPIAASMLRESARSSISLVQSKSRICSRCVPCRPFPTAQNDTRLRYRA
jgi:hypothetical protein